MRAPLLILLFCSFFPLFAKAESPTMALQYSRDSIRAENEKKRECVALRTSEGCQNLPSGELERFIQTMDNCRIQFHAHSCDQFLRKNPKYLGHQNTCSAYDECRLETSDSFFQGCKAYGIETVNGITDGISKANAALIRGCPTNFFWRGVCMDRNLAFAAVEKFFSTQNAVTNASNAAGDSLVEYLFHPNAAVKEVQKIPAKFRSAYENFQQRFACVDVEMQEKLACYLTVQAGSAVIGASGAAKVAFARLAGEVEALEGAEALKILRTNLPEVASPLGSKARMDAILGALGGNRDALYESLNEDFPAFLQKHRAALAAKNIDPAELEKLHEAIIAERTSLGAAHVEKDLAELKKKAKLEPVSCGSLNKLYPKAFGVGTKCTEVEFEKDLKGELCTCKSNGGIPGPFFTACADNLASYVSPDVFADHKALPSGNLLERCWRVDIPKGMKCYHGVLGPAFRGYGGHTQFLCQGSWMDRMLDQGGKKVPRREVAAAQGSQSIQLPSNKLSWTISRYSPMSEFAELRAVTSAGRECLETGKSACSARSVQTIQAQIEKAFQELYKSADATSRARLDAEHLEFQHYLEYLSGRRKLLANSELSDLSK